MIEITQVRQPKLSKLAGLAIDPKAQRIGYESNTAYEVDRDRSLDVLKGTGVFTKLSIQYGESYQQGRGRPSVIQYRDYVFSLILSESLYNTQYYGAQTLTGQATKVWTNYNYRDLWPNYDPGLEPNLVNGWGPLGSIAFYCYYLGSNSSNDYDWLSLIKGCLRVAWVTVGQRYPNESTVNRRLVDLFEWNIGLTRKKSDLFEEALTAYWEYPEIQKVLRRAGQLVKPDLVRQRLLTGEYDAYTWDLIMSEAPDKIQEEFQQITKSLLSLTKPGGLRLILQAAIIETLLEIGETLTEYANQSKLQDLPVPIKAHIAGLWATIADARLIQNYFDPVQANRRFKRNENLTLWLRLAGIDRPDLDLNSSQYRLNFFD
jgi:hypothetical protein